jgi:hypothetical protein
MRWIVKSDSSPALPGGYLINRKVLDVLQVAGESRAPRVRRLGACLGVWGRSPQGHSLVNNLVMRLDSESPDGGGTVRIEQWR